MEIGKIEEVIEIGKIFVGIGAVVFVVIIILSLVANVLVR